MTKKSPETPAKSIFKFEDICIEDINAVSEIASIAKLKLEEIIPDLDTLSCALYYSDYEDCDRIENTYAEETPQHKAAHVASYMKAHYYLKEAAVKGGFYARFTEQLLEIAVKNPHHGARLVPILNRIMLTAGDHGIDTKLECKILSQIVFLKEKFKFELLDVSDGLVKVRN